MIPNSGQFKKKKDVLQFTRHLTFLCHIVQLHFVLALLVTSLLNKNNAWPELSNVWELYY